MKLNNWIIVDSVESTQDIAKEHTASEVEVVFAHHQTKGRGRFDRKWESRPGESLTMSLILRDCANHPNPWLIAMTVAVVTAEILEANVRWPNDLSLNGKKVGGILTELVDGLPIVGIGLNIGQQRFEGELSQSATSLFLEGGATPEPITLGAQIAEVVNKTECPKTWSDLQGRWAQVDDTPGKPYRFADGRRGTAVRVGGYGELICRTKSGEESVLAADAMYLDPPSGPAKKSTWF